MRNLLVIVCVLLQLAVLSWIAGKREYLLISGKTVWLRTAPVDPRDLFRGDFVALDYDISRIPSGKWGPAAKKVRLENAVTVYATLKPGEDGVAELIQADIVRPGNGALFIKGQKAPDYWRGIDYGIGSFFVQQGKGHQMEGRAPEGIPSGFSVPREMEVTLAADGTAALKGGFRWAPLGIQITVPPGRGDGQSAPPVNEVSFVNASDKPQAVVLPKDLSSIRLEWQEMPWATEEGAVLRPAFAARHPSHPFTDADVRVLAPHETVTVKVNPADPRWFVGDAEKGGLRPINRNEVGSCRLVYQVSAEDCKNLSRKAQVWHGALSRRLGGWD